MAYAYQAHKISDTVYWVGAIDWGLRNFHGYLTGRGSTYNAFLIVADKVTLIDAVKPGFYDEMIGRISSVIDPSKIDYVVSNHAEMDHSGTLPRVIQELKPSKVFASPKGVEALQAHFHWDVEVTPVKTGQELDLGNRTLQFIEAPMLHWPDSMFAFLKEEGVLFSNDAFGMHLACSERFADEVEPYVLRYEASKYYANILLHLSGVVGGLLKKFATLNLDTKIIAPDHGPIWRHNIGQILEWYGTWAAQKPTKKTVLIYDTMWQSTSKMANAVCDGLIEGGSQVVQLPLDVTHRSDVVTELLEAGALIVGSPTINNQIYPTVAGVMNYLKGLKPKNLIGASFGSYGWSGESIQHLDQLLTDMKIELVQSGVGVKYVPTDTDLEICRNLGRAVAERLPR